MTNQFRGRRDLPCLSPSAEMNGVLRIIILRHTFSRRIKGGYGK